MFSAVVVIILGVAVGGKCGVLYHRQQVGGGEAPDYHQLDDGGVRLIKLTRTLVPVQVALPSVPAVSAVPAAAVPALPPGPVVLAAPQFLLQRVALAFPQQYPHHPPPQHFAPEQYSPPSQAPQFSQQRSRPTFDHHQHDDGREKPYSRVQHEQFHYNNKQH